MNVFNCSYPLLGRIAALILGGLASGSAQASPAVVQPAAADAQDVFVYQAMPTFNFDANGFERFIVTGKSTVGHDLQGLLKFDLAGLSLAPSERATLHLYVTDTTSTGFPGVSPSPAGAAVIEAATASGAWTASTATWSNRAATARSIDAVTISGINQWVTFDVTAAVQGWLANPATNDGLVLSQQAAVNNGGWVGVVFESSADVNRPYLAISAVPEPASVAVVASVLLLLGRRNRG